jgi:hypothetical protein
MQVGQAFSLPFFCSMRDWKRHLDARVLRHHDVYMRTTLTVEDDIAVRLADLARESRRSFKEVVNETLRRGLSGVAKSETRFVVKPHHGNLRPGIDDRRFNELIWELEESRLPGARAGGAKRTGRR